MGHAVEKGLLLVYTGNGKGKSTAALGQALRAIGHGQRVCIVQFIKNLQTTGEVRAITTLLPELIEIHPTGTGFTWKEKDEAKLRRAAEEGWRLARDRMNSGDYQLVIFDELTYPLSYGLLDEAEVLAAIAARPPACNVVVTGRAASAALQEMADLVTEMREVKHHYKNNIAARKGIEF